MQKSQEQFRHMEQEGDIVIFDTDGGSYGTITRRAWHVF